MNTNTMPLEAETRVLIDRSLENLGWKLNGKDQNVYYEQPRSEAEKKKLGGKRPDYVLYSKDSDKPLIVIEAKKKGVRLDAALEQGIQYAKAIEAPLVFATDGVFCRAFHTVANRPPILNGEEIDEFIREALALRYLTSYEVNTVSPKVQYDRKELIRIFDEANNMLRGEGLRAGIERFGEFANILFLKLISESEQIKKESGIQTKFDISCSWDNIKQIPFSARIEYINNTVYKRLNSLYNTDIFTPLQIRDSSILKEIMDKLDPLMLTDVDSDVKGDAFEYFLKASTATKNDLGEYFTPRHIVKTMVRLVNPKIGEKIYDPFCGTGGFLIESFRYIERSLGSGNPELKRILREETIYGNEITNTARITKMNMILAGDGHSNIHMMDSLANPTYIDKIKYDENGKIIRDADGNIEYSSEYSGVYDIVLANMPYSQKTKHGNLYDLPSTNGDSICVQHCMKAINSTAENGRMALVVPEGFLFRKDLAKTREYLLDHCQLQSIISLPQGVFLPYTGVKTDIIYATNVNKKIKVTERKKNFWYFDVKSDGYTLDNHRRKLDTPSDLAKYEEYRKLDEEQTADMLNVGFEVIPLEKVRENSYILVGSRYREQKEITSNYEIVSIGSVASLVSGYAFPMALQGKDGTIPFYKVGDMNTKGNEVEMHLSNNYVSNELAASKKWGTAPTGTVIFPKIGAAIATNKKRILTESSLFDNNVMGIICGDRILPKFMLYLLNSIDISQWASLSNPPSISMDAVLKQQIPLPPLDIQRQIVRELDGYQQVIAGAKMALSNYLPTISCSSGSKKALEDIAIFKPAKDEVKSMLGETDVSFVPMADINTFDASFTPKENRKLSEVLSGFTYFKDNDILLAKITPCFENGKAAIARKLTNGIGFGSTEYIVIRANTSLVYPEWIFYHINTPEFIEGGKAFMTGTAGQQRVDINYVKQYRIPVPSLEDQKKILDQISYEQSLIEPSKQLIKVFTEKIETRIKEVWGE
ncbi:MAG: N-6 DNA methylase [Clostridiales bacterium]|nr:N-6 DNA methylase [Clostridiales bacterium]